MKKLEKQDIIDILYGCTVLGTGGGGSLARGLEMMQEDFDEDRPLYLAIISELPDKEYVATPYGCGAPSAGEEVEPEDGVKPAMLAFQALERYIGKKFCAVSSTELGGENTAEALHVAAQLGIPIADGDPAGRSVPELIQSTYYLYGKSIAPLSVATNYGEVAILETVRDDFRAESLVRAMATVSGNEISVCDHPMTGKEWKNSVIPGALSYAWGIGKLLRQVREDGGRGAEVARAITENYDGELLFRGTVTAMPWECRDGFDFGSIHLKGIGEFENNTYRIDFQNENIASYYNEKLDVTVPDLICMIDEDGVPVTTPDFAVGDEMQILALPAPEPWTTPEGLKIFGPEHFGLDTKYVPFSRRKRG